MYCNHNSFVSFVLVFVLIKGKSTSIYTHTKNLASVFFGFFVPVILSVCIPLLCIACIYKYIHTYIYIYTHTHKVCVYVIFATIFRAPKFAKTYYEFGHAYLCSFLFKAVSYFPVIIVRHHVQYEYQLILLPSPPPPRILHYA